MSDQDYTTEYTNGNSYASDTTTSVKSGLSAVKEKVSEQASDLKNQFNAQASSIGSQLGQKIDNARGKTSAQLRNTSERIQNLASYVEQNDAKDMSDALIHSSQEMVRKHPGKSILAGIVVGILVGRLFSIGGK